MSPKDNNKQVSAAVRILHQKRDASARATHLKAGNWIVQFSTIERKKMSTKTSFKRIALVAASALAIAGFSAVPSQAAAGYPTFTQGAGTLAITGTTTATASATVGSYQSFLISFVGETALTSNVTSTGVGTLVVPNIIPTGAAQISTITTSTTSAVLYGTTAATDVPGIGAALANQSISISAYSTAAGTQTITAGKSTLTITWAAAASYSAAYSKAILNNLGNSAAAGAVTDDTVSIVKGYGKAGLIAVTVKNGSNGGYNSATVSATVSGSGLIEINGVADNSTLGNSRADSFAAVGGVAYIHISGDNTSGSGAVTVSVTDGTSTTVLATKTVTFTSTVTAATSQANLKVLKAGAVTSYAGAGSVNDAVGFTTTVAVTGFTKDAAGNKAWVAADAVKVVSSDTAVLVAGACIPAAGGLAVTGEYNCSVTAHALAASGKSATITFQAVDSAGAYTISAAPVTFTVGGSPAKVSLSTDAASYAPGAGGKIIVSAKDSSGNPAADADYAALLGNDLVSSVANPATTLPTGTLKLRGGSVSANMYAPVSAGDFVISGTTGASSADVGAAISTTATVEGDASSSLALDAANAATDAANNAYDEAQNATQAASDALAAVTELAAQVTSLIAMVKTQTAAVAKLTAAVAKLSKKK